ncbi:hypothetical protein QYM36_017989, partial [Artemia franciscana]
KEVSSVFEERVGSFEVVVSVIGFEQGVTHLVDLCTPIILIHRGSTRETVLKLDVGPIGLVRGT